MSYEQRAAESKTGIPSPLYGVSLFSGAGIGDLGFRSAGVSFLAMCEKASDRAALAQLNFPEAKVHTEDVNNVEDDLCRPQCAPWSFFVR